MALRPPRVQGVPSQMRALTLRLCVCSSLAIAAGAQTCPDRIMPNTGIGGGGTVTALRNVSSKAECCSLCHGDYHDECHGWVYGPTGGVAADPLRSEAGSLQPHNCAIMATNGPPRNIAEHVSGITKDAPPPPPPPMQGEPCNADIDCAPATAALWRCRQSDDREEPVTASNSCHLPGPGTAGNSTCACTIQTCTNTSGPVNVSATQYLVIGDSISLGMNSDLRELVSADGWQLTHSPGNAASSNLGAHCVDSWVQPSTRKWDVISFQFGLHDLGYDTERISVQQYSTLLTQITHALASVQKAHGTKLLWVKTTPVPTVPTYSVAGPCNQTSECLNPPRYDDDVVLYNTAADAVIMKANASGAKIVTADLYSFVLKKCGGKGYVHCDGFQLPMNVHYTAAGWKALAAEMHSILKTL
eukprot:SAG31_NODE_525_length_14489_cov_3.693815_8_plen_416_part_00